MEALRKRIEAVEDEVSALRSQHHALQTEIVSRRLVLQDPEGNPRATIETIAGAVELRLLGPGGTPRVSLVVNQELAAVFVADVDGIARIGLTVEHDGQAGVGIQDQHMQLRAEVSVDSDDVPAMAMYNADQSVLWQASE